VSALRRTADSLVYTEQSNLGGGAFQQTVTLVLDPSDGSSRRLDRVTIQQGQRSEAHLTYSGGRVKGRSAMAQQDGTTKPFDIDTVLPPGTIDEDAVPFSVPAFPLDSGKTFTVSFFSPSDGAVKLLTFKVGAEESMVVDRAQYPSTYRRHPNPPVLIRNATIMTATGQEIRNGSILFKDGRIVAVGEKVDAPADAAVVDGAGKYVTPGLIDDHSHLGVYAAPGTEAESDGNEATNPVTAEVWAEHSFWPQDPQIPLAIAGGITTIQALPGSANLIGGRSAILKLIPARTVQEMKFPGAHYGLKMACGENPKRVYGRRGGPSTRMGNMAGYRSAFTQAETYRRRWDTWRKDHKGDPPERNLRLETLAEVLRGNMYVQNHCYRADEMAQMIDLAHEFGFKIRSFHHAVESYKIA